MYNLLLFLYRPLRHSAKMGKMLTCSVIDASIYRCYCFSTSISYGKHLANVYCRSVRVTSYNNFNRFGDASVAASETMKYLQDLRVNPRLTSNQRLALLDELWSDLEINLALKEEHFLLKLETYLKCRKKTDPKAFLKKVEEAGLEKTEKLLKALLVAVAEHGDAGYVSSVITSMKSRNFVVDETVFSCLITAYAVAKDNQNVQFVLNSMKECGMKPGPQIYTSLMRAAGIADDYAALHTARAQAQQNGIKFTDESILFLLETFARNNRIHLMPSLKPLVEFCSTDQLNHLAIDLVYSGFPSGAYSVLKLKNDTDLTAECKELVQEMLLANAPLKQLIYVAGKMVEDETYSKAFYDILYMKMMDSKTEEALAVIKRCQDSGQTIRPHFFYPLITTAHRQNGEQGVWEILEFMKEFNIKPDSEALTDFVLPRLTIDEDWAVLKRLQEASGSTISSFITPYLSYLLKNGKLQQAVKIYEKYEKSVPSTKMPTLMAVLKTGYLLTRDYKTTARLIHLFQIQNIGNWLHMLFSTRKWLPLGEYSLLFEELTSVGCWITPQEEKWLLQLFLRNDTLTEQVKLSLRRIVKEEGKSAAPVFIPRPENMTANELENHVIELESKGGNTRGALRQLLQKCCRTGDAEGAQQAYKKLVDMQADLSPGILSSIFHVNVLAGNLNDALEIFQKIKENYKKFQVDSFKILDLATLLVKSDKYQDALLVINRNPVQQRNNMKSIERNCWELLTATAETENSVENVKEMFKLLLVNNFCQGTNITLGPLIKAFLKRDDLEGAVAEFSACARNYKKTPSQVDVMLAAVSREDEQMISKIVDSIGSVHGMDSANVCHIAALALAGNVNQTRLIWKASELTLKNEKLCSQIERMSDSGQIDGLRLLFIVCCDEQDSCLDFLINRIFYAYQRIGDTDGALNFWTEIQGKGIELSDAQKSSLASLVASTSQNKH